MEDVVSPIALRLNLSLVGEPIPSSQNLHPVLAEGSEDLVTAYVSLQHSPRRACRSLSHVPEKL